MRSHTNANLYGRCHACHQRLEICPCAVLPRIETQTRIIVIRHALESLKTTNTARLASLILPGLRIVSWGGIEDDAHDAIAAIPEDGAVMLYPMAPERTASGEGAFEGPRTLIVPDGNWNQSKRIVRRLLQARPMPFFGLADGPARTAKRLREPIHAGQRSTLEAIAAALGRVEDPSIEARLLAAYDDFVLRITRTSGRLRARDRALL